MAKEHLNYEQMGLTHGAINSLSSHKGVRNLLGHLVNNSPTRVIAQGGKNHIKLYFENDGLITMSKSPSDNRAMKNNESQIRRSLSSHGFEYQTMSEFGRKSKKQNIEQEPEE